MIEKRLRQRNVNLASIKMWDLAAWPDFPVILFIVATDFQRR